MTRAPAEAQAAVAGAVGQLNAGVSSLPAGLSPLERAKMLAARFGKDAGGGARGVGLPMHGVQAAGLDGVVGPHNAALARARALAAQLGGPNFKSQGVVHAPTVLSSAPPTHFSEELDINDYPGEARYRATHRDQILRVQEETGTAIISRGQYVAPGKPPDPSVKRLYLAIEGKDELSIKAAKAEMKRLLNEETMSLAASGGRRGQSALANFGKYSLI